MLVQWKILWWSDSGMPIMSQITCSGSGPESSGHQFAAAVGWVGDEVGHQPLGPVPYRFLRSRNDFRGEGTAHDVAKTGVARVVEGDHRPEVLCHLRRRSPMVMLG